MRHDGRHIWADSDNGETPTLIFAAIGMAAFLRAEPIEAADEPRDPCVSPEDIVPFIRPDGSELFMLVFRGCDASLQVTYDPVSGAFKLNVDLYAGQPEQLLESAEYILATHLKFMKALGV